jgi:hypothetical protein
LICSLFVGEAAYTLAERPFAFIGATAFLSGSTKRCSEEIAAESAGDRWLDFRREMVDFDPLRCSSASRRCEAFESVFVMLSSCLLKRVEAEGAFFCSMLETVIVMLGVR